MSGAELIKPARLERNHIMLALALAMLAGCRIADVLEPGLWLWGALAIGAALVFIMRWARRSALLAIMLCVFTLGALRAGQCLNPKQPQPGTYELQGYVYGDAMVRSSNRVSFIMTDFTLNGEPQYGRVYCTMHGQSLPKLFDGANVHFMGYVYRPMGKSGEPHFDYRMWIYGLGLQYGVSIREEVTLLNQAEDAPWMDHALHIRKKLNSALSATMGEEARVAMAMLFSDRDGLSDEEMDGFRTLGIAHVLSVSGLHIALLGGALMLLLQ